MTEYNANGTNGHSGGSQHDQPVRIGQRVRESNTADGLTRFGQWLNPELVRQIRAWEAHPELGRLHSSLVGHVNPKTFLDTYAEAMVARHLLQHQIPFRFEVLTPHGKQCDFEIELGGRSAYLHVKRLTAERSEHNGATISSRMRYLEGIRRPFEVKVRWQDRLSERQLQTFVRDASQFIQRGHVGDEFVVRDETGAELGGVLIQAPYDGPHVRLVVGTPDGFVDQTHRISKLMRRAARQFMPGATNVVLICGEDNSHITDFESALLGSHVERWDRFPPQGSRIAHGRDADGFWHDKKFIDCKAAGWFRFKADADRLSCRLYLRENVDLPPGVESGLTDLFDTAGR